MIFYYNHRLLLWRQWCSFVLPCSHSVYTGFPLTLLHMLMGWAWMRLFVWKLIFSQSLIPMGEAGGLVKPPTITSSLPLYSLSILSLPCRQSSLFFFLIPLFLTVMFVLSLFSLCLCFLLFTLLLPLQLPPHSKPTPVQYTHTHTL